MPFSNTLVSKNIFLQVLIILTTSLSSDLTLMALISFFSGMLFHSHFKDFKLILYHILSLTHSPKDFNVLIHLPDFPSLFCWALLCIRL